MEDKKKKNDKIYLDKEALWVEVDKYYETDIISEELGQMIIDLANNIMSGRNFSGYVYNEEMRGNAILTMMKALDKRKCKLWTQKKERTLEEFAIECFRFPDNFKLESNEKAIIGKFCPEKQEANISIYIQNEGEFFVEEDGDLTPVFSKKGTQVHKLIYDEDSNLDIWSLVNLKTPTRNRKQKYENAFVFNELKEEVIVKSNLFGYFTNIANHAAIEKIKREGRTEEAQFNHGEEEFTQFLANNPDMAPQRVDSIDYNHFKEEQI